MVPPASDRVSPAPPYSGYSYGRARLRIRGFHALRPPFPPISLSYNPARASTRTVWAPPLSLAATRGITVVFSSSGYLDVSVPRVGPASRCHAFCMAGSPIRTSADLRPFAPTRGFSQLVTSFVASESQGIPRTPLIDFLVSSSIVKFILLQAFPQGRPAYV